MILPKALQPDDEYGDEIRNTEGELAACVYGKRDDPSVQEFRDEIIRRYNAYETLYKTLKAVSKAFDEVL